MFTAGDEDEFQRRDHCEGSRDAEEPDYSSARPADEREAETDEDYEWQYYRLVGAVGQSSHSAPRTQLIVVVEHTRGVPLGVLRAD